MLLATDAAGEGVNLQNANLMVNYDLPWNPNRIEQRFGRIHRIGQTEVCHLWNMVASETREGDVFQKLFEKMEIARQALKGKVFDVLGEVFEETSLRDMLIQAIRYGDDPAVRARLHEKMDGVLDTDHLENIIRRNALCEEVIDEARLFSVKEEMEKAEARRLQPYFIRSFFNEGFRRLGGELRSREKGRYEITHVPASIREGDRQVGGRQRRNIDPVVRSYERVCFEKQYVRLTDRPNAPMASMLHPAHPLMHAVTSLTLELHRSKLKQGAILLNLNDMSLTPKLMFIIDHSIKESCNSDRIVSRRIQFIEIDQQGVAVNAGYAPHLDLQIINEPDIILFQDILKAAWITQDLEQQALAHASMYLVPEHFKEVRSRRECSVDKILGAVHERLVKEINFWSGYYNKLKEDGVSGKDVRLALENVHRTIDDLSARRESREKELLAMRNVISATPVIVGGALIIPAGLFNHRKGVIQEENNSVINADARSHIEYIAMNAVMNAERALGNQVVDVSKDKCGWDITSIPQSIEGHSVAVRHIEVKGRSKGQGTITVTRNEILYGLNQADKFILAIVIVDGDQYSGPFYVKNPFSQEPDWAVSSINLNLDQLLARAEKRI